MHPRLALGLLAFAAPVLAAGSCNSVPLLPDLVASSPAPGASVARSTWFVLDFATDVSLASKGRLRAECNGVGLPLEVAQLDADTLVVQPKALLPAGAGCEIFLGTTSGSTTVSFQTLAAGTPFTAVYDRRDPDRPLPFPDDAFLTPDAGTATGYRPAITTPNPPGTAATLINSLAAVTEASSDGWSPVGDLAVELTAAPDSASLPLGRAASLDPLSSIALIDLTPGSPSFGQRVPFALTPRSDTFPPEPVSHDLVLFPGIPLEPEGTYGLVVTDRVLDTSGEPLAASAFFAAAKALPVAGEDPEIALVRPLADEVLAVAETLSPVPIPRDDVVLAVRITIRSTSQFPDDVLAMRADVLATPPDVQISSVTADADPDVAAKVVGSFVVPKWLTTQPFVDRGPDGLPHATTTQTVPFVLMLPAAANAGNAPIVMYQHGNPGSAEAEVPGAARSFLGAAGFAVGGFTDTLNRQFSSTDEQSLAVLGVVLLHGEAPDFYIQTYAEQIAFVRALQELGATLDVLPLGAPDGVPDLDPTAIVYEGISYGANHGQAFLAYEPDILAAALVAGADRLAELLEYQDRTTPLGEDPLFRVVLPSFLSGVRAPDLWMGLALFACNYDRQDPHNHARFLFREPLSIDGTTRKASVLVVEGIGDSFTTNNSTRSLAWQLGPIPQLLPAAVPVPDLPQQAGPIQANVDPDTTAALVQFVPAGTGLPPTPGCESQFEGHYCAQTAPSSRALRVQLYQTALGGPPLLD